MLITYSNVALWALSVPGLATAKAIPFIIQYLLILETLSMYLYCHDFSNIFVFIAAFVNTPTSVNATLNSTATFNCSTNAPTGTFEWLVNGLLLGQLNTPDIAARQVGRTSFLHVLAKEEYDNTSVVCELDVRNPVQPKELSDPALLRVQGIHIPSPKIVFAAVP